MNPEFGLGLPVSMHRKVLSFTLCFQVQELRVMSSPSGKWRVQETTDYVTSPSGKWRVAVEEASSSKKVCG